MGAFGGIPKTCPFSVLGNLTVGLKGVHCGQDLLEGSPEGHIHFRDRGLAGDIGHFNPTSRILGELQTCADGHTLGRGIDVAPIIAAKGGVRVHPGGRGTEVLLPFSLPVQHSHCLLILLHAKPFSPI